MACRPPSPLLSPRGLHAPRGLSPPRLEIPVLPEVPAMAISFNLPSTPVAHSPEMSFRSIEPLPADRPSSPACGFRSPQSPAVAPVYMAPPAPQTAPLGVQFRCPSPVPSMASMPGGNSPWRAERVPRENRGFPERSAVATAVVPGTGLEALMASGPSGSIAQRLNDTHLVPLRHMVPPRCDSQTTQSTMTMGCTGPAGPAGPAGPVPPVQDPTASPFLDHRLPGPVAVPQPHAAAPMQLAFGPNHGQSPLRPAACYPFPPTMPVFHPQLPAPNLAPNLAPVLRFSNHVASPRAVPTAEATRQVQLPPDHAGPPPQPSPPRSPATPPPRAAMAPPAPPAECSGRMVVQREDLEIPTSPPDAKGEDSLAQQLRALQLAKEEAAAATAQSEQAILMRRGQLKRETFLALKSGGLSEALRHWPSPEHPALSTPSPEHRARPAPAGAALAAAPARGREVVEEPPAELSLPATEPLPSEGELVEIAAEEENVPRPEAAAPQMVSVPSQEPEVTEMPSRISKAESGAASRPLTFEEEAVQCCKTLSKIAGQISSKHLRDLRKPRQLPPQVVKILQAIALLLGHKDLRVSNLKKLLADTLPQKLSSFDPRRMTPLQRSKLRQLLGGAEVSPDQVAKVCLPFTSLAQWCECVMSFLNHTQPSQSEKERREPAPAPAPVAEAGTGEAGTGEAVPKHERSRRESGGSGSRLLVQPDLTRLDAEELREVQDLTITKPNIGSVVFHGLTDCSFLDLQKDIVLKRGYVLVYPDAKRKPPVGEGLNKPATVTMYECFPPGEQIGEKEAKDYKEKIRRMTEENGACKFIDYDCQTGVWKFDVARF